MNRILKSSLFAATVLALGAATGTAAARTLPAQAGHALMAVDAPCFDDFYGAARNSHCASGRYWGIPLVIDPAGWYTVNVATYAPPGVSNPDCFAYTVMPFTTYDYPAVWGSGVHHATQNSTAEYVPLTFYNPGGFSMSWCVVYPGAQVNGVNY